MILLRISLLMFKCECLGSLHTVLTAAEEERFDSRVVHNEEAVSDEVASKHHSLKRQKRDSEQIGIGTPNLTEIS